MNQRRLLCRNIHRKQMEKYSGRKKFGFVIFASFVFFIFLLYFNSSALIRNGNMVLSSMNEHAYSVSIMSPESNPLLVTEEGDQPISQIPVNHNGLKPVDILDINEDRVEPIKVTRNWVEPSSGLPINVIGEDSTDLVVVSEIGFEPVTENGMKHVNRLDATKDEPKSISGDELVNELSIPDNREERVNPLPVKDNRAKPVKRLEKGEEPANELAISETGNQPMNQLSIRGSIPVDRVTVTNNEADTNSDPCAGKYVYVHDLPSRFNDDMLKECRSLSLWTDMCHFLSNGGLGPKLQNSQGAFPNRGWFATDQFALEVIFNNRMKQYKCLTKNSSLASAIFVPYYAGLDVARYLWGFNTSMRDATSLDLVEWLVKRPEWKVLGGRDHFLVAGRITWDFRRLTDSDADWGNNLLSLPEAKNMSVLVIESSPWHSNDFAIPYPTYFHPSTDNEVFQWQNRMRRQKKRYLFSFAGAPRLNIAGSIRSQIIDQCQASRKKCKLLECNKGANKCNNPSYVMKMFQNSVFCLQPSGDSFTRRSTFDSILAGCIPVFFHPGSAYVQYSWHLPQNYSKYSVLIPENDVRDGKVIIESRLQRISKAEVRAMREEVIRMIPRLIYADPRTRLETLDDAFDIAVKGVIERVNGVREGRIPGVAYEEENYWKYSLFGTVGEHEWDHFFSKPKNAT